MTPLTRTWLRRIALGLPIVAPALQGCVFSSTAGCHPPEQEVSYELASVPRADGGIDCVTACRELASTVDAGVPLEYPSRCAESTGDAGIPVLVCRYYEYLCEGRRPQSLLAATAIATRSAIGAWLAQAAHLEAASVPAFSELAFELGLHGAPPVLERAARRAAVDEIVHARSVAQLAERFGAATPEVRRAPASARSMRELAIDNAIEGCAREAYGALASLHQAQRASDPEVARAFASIARDEARHALFSLAMNDWIGARLRPRDRREVDEARREALEALGRELEHEPDPALRDVLGAPDAERAIDLSRALV